MKEAQIIKAYEAAKERYAQIGIDTDEALKKLQNISLSLHCWQTDDVTGFENRTANFRAVSRLPVTIPARPVISRRYARISRRPRA